MQRNISIHPIPHIISDNRGVNFTYIICGFGIMPSLLETFAFKCIGIDHIKDRQHRSKGGMGFLFINH